MRKLANPVNDAEAIAQMLQKLAFSVVLVINGAEQAIIDCVDKGLDLVERPEVALFHFSGHGVQFDDSNFLVALDADASAIPMRGFVPLQSIVEKLQSRADATLIFLDACRDNPLAQISNSGLSASSGRSIKRGAAPSQIGKTGTLIAYATSPNAVAFDGKGSFSPFSRAILETMPTPGYSVQRMMSEITRMVGEATDWAQTPWVRSSLNKELKLLGNFSLDQVQATSRNWAETALVLNEKGRRKDAIVAALKGLPKDPDLAQEKYFPEAMDALYRIVRSDRTWIDPKGSLFTLERSANGAVIALSIQTDEGIMIQVWDARTHRRLLEFPTGHVSYSLDPSGARLAVSSPPGQITLWNIAARKIITSFSGSPLPVSGQIKWSPDGKTVAVNDGDNVTVFGVPQFESSSDLTAGKSVSITGVEGSFADNASLCVVRHTGAGMSVGWIDLRGKHFTKVGSVAVRSLTNRIVCDRTAGTIALVYTENIDDQRGTAWLKDGRRVDVDVNGLHVTTLTVSPDQHWLALADNSGNITVHEAAAGKSAASPFAKLGYSDGYGHVYYGPEGGQTTTPSYQLPPPDVWRETPTGRSLIDLALGLIDADQLEQLKAERVAVGR